MRHRGTEKQKITPPHTKNKFFKNAKTDGCLTYYTRLPPSTEVATLDMFYNNGKPITWLPFLCKSINSEKYFALRVGAFFPSTLQRAQIINKNVYVFKNSDGSVRIQ